LAWLLEDRGKCPGCGVPLDEATSDEAAWVASATICFACKARERTARPYHRTEGGGDGLLLSVSKDN
jgi:hypothetical protein